MIHFLVHLFPLFTIVIITPVEWLDKEVGVPPKVLVSIPVALTKIADIFVIHCEKEMQME